MANLASVDLKNLFVDVSSLLGRAAAAGLETGDLSPRFADALMAWLRARALDHARRYRTGIAVGRDSLRRGVERAWRCVDTGLQVESGGDITRAVACLAETKLQVLHDRGYEQIFANLMRMAAESQQMLADDRTLSLLPEHTGNLRMWACLVPETWSAPGVRKDDEDVIIDPTAAWEQFESVRAEMMFAASLPRLAAQQLLQDETGYDPDLANLMRRVWVALLLKRESLAVDDDVVAALSMLFKQSVGDATKRSQQESAARAALDEHLAGAIDDEAQRDRLRRMAHAELERMRS